jgi:hypothetical protein
LSQLAKTLEDASSGFNLAMLFYRRQKTKFGARKANAKRAVIGAYADFFERLGRKATAPSTGDSPFLRFLHIVAKELGPPATQRFTPGLNDMARLVLRERRKEQALRGTAEVSRTNERPRHPSRSKTSSRRQKR